MAARGGAVAWLAACALHGGASLLVAMAGPAVAEALRWHPHAPVWTWWSSAWVHLHGAHLLANQLALAAVAVGGWAMRVGGSAVAAWCGAWPLLVAVQPWWPAVQGYAGLSGLLHAGVTVLAVQGLCGGTGAAAPRGAALALGAGLSLKLALEAGWREPLAPHATLAMEVVQSAHWAGALCGAGLGAVLVCARARFARDG